MLISVIAVENLKKSSQIQSIQKESVDSLYEAEEGIEFSLYANKQKDIMGMGENPPFSISVWDNNNDNKTGDRALERLRQPTQNQDVVVSSENITNQNDNKSLKRTVFANLPSRYYDQVPLWDRMNGCDADDCIVFAAGPDMAEGDTYQVVSSVADFQKDIGWESDDTEYRLVFKCGGDEECTIDDLKVGVGIGCDYSKCDITGCTSFMGIDFRNGDNSGRTILSDWFKYLDSDKNVVDLRNSKIVVQFKLVRGSMEEITNLPGEDLKMCRQQHSSWSPVPYSSGGLSSLEIRRESEQAQYHCTAWEQVCTEYYQICDQQENYCCGGPSYYCEGYPAGDSNCNANNVNVYGCYNSGCLSYGYCRQGCAATCTRCIHTVNGSCIPGHYQNGKCIHWSRD